MKVLFPLLISVVHRRTFLLSAAVLAVVGPATFTARAQQPAAGLPPATASKSANALASPGLVGLAETTSPFVAPLAASSVAPAESTSLASDSLPDAPDPNTPAADAGEIKRPREAGLTAPLYTKDISAGWEAQPLTARDKFMLGVRDLYSPGNFGAMFLSSGYSHLTNGQPNYGTDRGAYGERLGAAAIRETSQGFFTDSIFAPLLHQDPRYYVLGPEASIGRRTLYAITRPILRRNDSGRNTLNTSLLLGYGAAALLTEAYYPGSNHNARDTAATYGASIGGSALGFVVSEFADQLLVAVHVRKPD